MLIRAKLNYEEKYRERVIKNCNYSVYFSRLMFESSQFVYAVTAIIMAILFWFQRSPLSPR